MFGIFFPHTKVCFGALLREGVCYIGTGFAESPATCGNFIKVFICDRSVPQGERGEKDQQVSTRPSHINLAAALTAENHGSHSGIDLCLTYHFCPQVCNFPRCKVMKARRKKKKRGSPPTRANWFLQSGALLCCQRLRSDALRAVVKYN